MLGATKLLYFQINDLSQETSLKGGKAATQSGMIAAPPVHFAQSKHNPGLSSKGALGRMPAKGARISKYPN
jgi:hypothetical protein